MRKQLKDIEYMLSEGVEFEKLGEFVISPLLDICAKLGKTKTFAKYFRKNVDRYFSARGVAEEYGVSFYTFLKRMPVYSTTDELSYNMLDYSNTDISYFAEILIEDLLNDKKMNEKTEPLQEIKVPMETKYEDHPFKISDDQIEEFTKRVLESGKELGHEVPEIEDGTKGTWSPKLMQEAVKELGKGLDEQGENDESPVAEPKDINEFLEPEPVSEDKGEPFKADDNGVHTQFMLNIPVTKIFEEAIKQHMQNGGEEKIAKQAQALIEKEVQKLQPNYVTINGATPVEITGQVHKKFDISLKLLISERQIFISGPAGSGKTTLGCQIAEALQLRFAHISCTAGMSEAHLLGRMVADGTYIQSEFVDLYENGGVFLFDEVDAADSNTLLIINSALANGRMSVPNRKDNPAAVRHKDFYAVCAGNTWGRGSAEYNGRMLLDAAFLDRFAAGRVEVDYDGNLEKQILTAYPEAYKELNAARDNIKKNQLKRIISTRAYASAARLLQQMEFSEFVEVLTTGWAKEEVQKTFPDKPESKPANKKVAGWINDEELQKGGIYINEARKDHPF